MGHDYCLEHKGLAHAVNEFVLMYDLELILDGENWLAEKTCELESSKEAKVLL